MALVVKNPPANAGEVRDAGSVPGSERSPGAGHGNPLHYSCLENPVVRWAWRAAAHGVAKSPTQLKRLSMHHTLCSTQFLTFLLLIFLFFHLQSNFAFSPHVTLLSQLWPWALLLVRSWMFLLCCFIFPRIMHLFQLPVGGAPAWISPTGKHHLRVTSTSCRWCPAKTASPTGESCNLVWFEGHQACQPKLPLAAYLKFQPRIISVAP